MLKHYLVNYERILSSLLLISPKLQTAKSSKYIVQKAQKKTNKYYLILRQQRESQNLKRKYLAKWLCIKQESTTSLFMLTFFFLQNYLKGEITEEEAETERNLPCVRLTPQMVPIARAAPGRRGPFVGPHVGCFTLTLHQWLVETPSGIRNRFEFRLVFKKY